MSLVTGTPQGSITSQEDIYLESAPSIYFQDYNATPLFNPDSDGFYWGMSGTSTYEVRDIGCVSNVTLTENLTVNDVLCDNVGVKDTVQQRNYIEFTFEIMSLFPFSTLSKLLKMSTVTVNAGENTEKFGIGSVNNDQYYMVYAPKVYNTDVGDYIMVHLHKAKLVDPFTINMPFGAPWVINNLKFRAFADTSKPDAQKFGVFLRSDASVL